MRLRSASLTFLLSLLPGVGGIALAQSSSCVNLQCQQQVCSNNGTTSISGTVYAPNGIDPLPNVTVYIPNDVVQPFTPGVQCPIVGSPPSGSPLVGTETDVNGNFTLVNVPVGSNIPLVIISGRWRRQLVVPSTTACTNTAMPSNFAVMPSNQTQGDIPKIAIATGAVDQVECVLLKMGISETEFTDPSGSGRINLFTGSGGPGAEIDSATPTQASLMENASTLNQYDVLMLPCQGTPSNNVVSGAMGTTELANFVNFANAGGRIYSSHYSYAWMFQNPPFNTVVNWSVGQGDPPDGPATVNTSFSAGQTLSAWLQEVGASTSPGQMDLNTLRVDTKGVVAPTQSWLTLNSGITGNPNPVMQFVFDTPVNTTSTPINQCGRVLFNEYHVENGTSSPTQNFPQECGSGTTMTPQEKLLEYMLFELTDEGGQPSLNPTSQDFGSEAIGFPSATETFTWTNNSSFVSQVTSAIITGDSDFVVTGNNCGTVAGGASCQITVVFTPSALGPGAATLTVLSGGGNSLTAALTGTGTPGYTLSGGPLTFGNLDIGASASQTLTLTSVASGPLPVPPLVTTGPFTVSTSACGTTLAAGASCPVKITFLPTTTGPLNGTVGVNSTSLLYSGLTTTFTGTGVDFTITLSPTSGSVIAGDSTSTTATLTPIAGFSSALSLLCQVAGANASSCGLSSTAVTPTAATNVTVSASTTSQYTVIGYGGFGGGRYLWLLALLSGAMLWRRRRGAAAMLRTGLAVVALAAIGLGLTSCSGKLPAQNAAYTGPGSYAITVTATDGFLVHSATYTLTVTAK